MANHAKQIPIRQYQEDTAYKILQKLLKKGHFLTAVFMGNKLCICTPDKNTIDELIDKLSKANCLIKEKP